MAEKRVSVRLVVEGGRVVRAELDGVGASGERAFNRIERSGDAVAGMMRTVAGLFAAGFSLGALAQAADQFTTMGNALRGLGMDQEAAGAALERLAEIAMRTHQPVQDVVQLYQRIAMASGDLGASQDDLFAFVEATTLALAQQGGPASQAAGALLQLGQALGGGTVRAEEWNSIMEGAPALAMAAAAGWGEAGVSVAELRNEILAGRVTSEAFFEAIKSQAAALEEVFKTLNPTIQQSMTDLNSALVMLVGNMDENLNASSNAARAIGFLAENLDVAAAVITGLVGTQIPALIAGLRAMGIASTLAFGPMGAVIGLVAAGASYFLLFRDNATTVSPVLEAVTTAQDALNTAMVLFSGTRSPEFGRQAIANARNLERQAQAALAATEAQIALIEAENQQRAEATGRYTPGGWTPDPAVVNPELRPLLAEAETLRTTLDGARRTLSALTLEMAAPPQAVAAALVETETVTQTVTDAMTRAGTASREAAAEALTGWQAVTQQLSNYAAQAGDTATQVADVMTGGMKRLEDAILDAFRGGTDGAREFFAYIAEEVARMAIRQTIIAPLGNWLSRTMGGIFGGGAAASVLHTGGLVGAGGASRIVDPAMFAAAPRYHSGGIAGLAPDEIPAILQRGERVIPRGQSGAGGIQVSIALRVTEHGGLEAFVERTSANVATTITGQGLTAFNRQLPDRVQQILNSPRKRDWT